MTKAAKAMKKAWEIFRQKGIRTMDAWKAALRQAWALVKGATKMVELVGSEKQIAWAEKIRAEIVSELKHYIRIATQNIASESSPILSPMRALQHRDKTPMLKAAKKELESVLEQVESVTSAKWFIEHRNGMWKASCHKALRNVFA
ncbi:hypothetical protein [Alicyclobacillus suci]|uniref:hypothetical protein n=1 Tax=Alicyclobacillus suci TaxID=2816080 RepID=UPI001A8F568D|nr:hypothetical protein [Alicyclobacillus suci]